ncbi:hypothetical protein GLAREA_07248 [Glarea lozoyensis ATCC 20868]|uniref:Uncharacterized protein n=1 Tax=Glarea lozoyensis (strain ATCC 20868 / MF5171) TaxID=1116229 RepID=S3D946_GLAL2|nr:uncharacterized protein GLAREA_07248 [Glarea lozoyensis ATCC 20868]EPE34235.1 hypothetical protein GLAREA_07248 [Glarea lozoyensis ATCC 20868]
MSEPNDATLEDLQTFLGTIQKYHTIDEFRENLEFHENPLWEPKVNQPISSVDYLFDFKWEQIGGSAISFSLKTLRIAKHLRTALVAKVPDQLGGFNDYTGVMIPGEIIVEEIITGRTRETYDHETKLKIKPEIEGQKAPLIGMVRTLSSKEKEKYVKTSVEREPENSDQLRVFRYHGAATRKVKTNLGSTINIGFEVSNE